MFIVNRHQDDGNIFNTSGITLNANQCTIADIINLVNTRNIDIVSRVLIHNMNNVNFIRDENWTSEIVNFIVDNSASEFRIIPRRFLTIDVCLAIFEYAPDVIEYIPKEYLNDKLIINAIKRDSSLFFTIPPELRSYEIVLAMVSERNNIFEYDFPECYMTKDMSQAIVNNISEIPASTMWMIPAEFRDQKFYERAFASHNLPYEEIPTEFRTREFLQNIILTNIHLINQIPISEFDQDLIDFIYCNRCSPLTKYYDVGKIDISRFPQELRSESLYKMFLLYGGRIGNIPKEDITPSIMITALRTNKDYMTTFDYLMREYGDNDDIICEYIRLKQRVDVSILTTKARCDVYVQLNQNGFFVIDPAFIDDEMYVQGILSGSLSIDNIPKDRLNEELCLISVRMDGETFRLIPQEFRTKNVCLATIRQKFYLIRLISNDMLCEISDELRADGLGKMLDDYLSKNVSSSTISI